MIRMSALLLLGVSVSWLGFAAAADQERPPIIDVHLHAYDPNEYAPAPNPVTGELPGSETAQGHMRETLARMDEHNIVLGFVSGGVETVGEWQKFAPGRFVGGAELRRPGVDGSGRPLSLKDLRSSFASGRIGLLGEVLAQYHGLSPSDPNFDPLFALAEEFDVPVAIHTGAGPPDTAQKGRTQFRLRLGNPLLLEDLLVRHLNLRVFMMHGGAPWLTETLAVLDQYSQVYVDLAVISWIGPREQFHRYLKALIEAGHSKRLMFGSDQMVWPEAIGLAIQGVESASFLTDEQKRDIYFNNAVRFFHLESRFSEQ